MHLNDNIKGYTVSLRGETNEENIPLIICGGDYLVKVICNNPNNKYEISADQALFDFTGSNKIYMDNALTNSIISLYSNDNRVIYQSLVTENNNEFNWNVGTVTVNATAGSKINITNEDKSIDNDFIIGETNTLSLEYLVGSYHIIIDNDLTRSEEDFTIDETTKATIVDFTPKTGTLNLTCYNNSIIIIFYNEEEIFNQKVTAENESETHMINYSMTLSPGDYIINSTYKDETKDYTSNDNKVTITDNETSNLTLTYNNIITTVILSLTTDPNAIAAIFQGAAIENTKILSFIPNDDETELEQITRTTDIKAGDYTLTITKDHFKTISTSINITRNHNSFTYKMENATGYVLFTSFLGATITIAGDNNFTKTITSEDGYNVELLPGNYTYTAIKEHYENATGAFEIKENETITLEGNLKGKPGKLTIKAEKGSTIEIRGQNGIDYTNDESHKIIDDTGEMIIENLTPGTYTFTATKPNSEEAKSDDYQVYGKTFTIEPEGDIIIEVQYSLKTGTLTITAYLNTFIYIKSIKATDEETTEYRITEGNSTELTEDVIEGDDKKRQIKIALIPDTYKIFGTNSSYITTIRKKQTDDNETTDISEDTILILKNIDTKVEFEQKPAGQIVFTVLKGSKVKLTINNESTEYEASIGKEDEESVNIGIMVLVGEYNYEITLENYQTVTDKLTIEKGNTYNINVVDKQKSSTTDPVPTDPAPEEGTP